MRCELFERFAAFSGHTDEVRQAGHPVHATQIDLARWQRNNFGEVGDRDMALGIVEECGELSEALSGHDFRDALGDIGIFAGQLLMLNRLSIEPLLCNVPRYATPHNRLGAVGKLCHVVLKGHQKIRGMNDRDVYRAALLQAVSVVLDVFDVKSSDYLEVAQTVLRRDFKKNKTNGEL